MSETFLRDTSGKTYSLIPVLVIDETGSSPLYISTHAKSLDDVSGRIYNLLKDVPRIRETLDVDEASVKNHHLVFSFYNNAKEIEGFNSISELFGDRELTNKRADLYFLSQSAKSLSDGYKIFSGFIKKAKHKPDTFQMEAESLAGVLFSEEVPSRNSKLTADRYPLARKDIIGKYLPIIFGEIDYSPAYAYGDKIYTSSPDFIHGTLKDKFVKIGTAEYPVMPIAIYQGGYWVMAPGAMTFTQGGSGLVANFTNFNYDPSAHISGGDHGSDYLAGRSIALSNTDYIFDIILVRKPQSAYTLNKSNIINWRIVEDNNVSPFVIIEDSKDWYSLDLVRGAGTVEIESISQYFRDVNQKYEQLPSNYEAGVLDLLSDNWVQIKGIQWIANDEANVSGYSYDGTFETEANYTQIVFNFRPLSEFIPESFELRTTSNYNTLLTRMEIDGSTDLPIVTLADVDVGIHEYSAGDSLVYHAQCGTHITVVKTDASDSPLQVGQYGNIITAGSQNVYHDMVIEHDEDNAQTFDNVYGSGEAIDNWTYNAQPLPFVNSLAFGVSKQQSSGAENHNGWLGAEGVNPATPYGNIRWNVEAKIYGAEIVNQAVVSVAELDLFASVRGVRIDQYSFMNLQELHFNDGDIDTDALQSHPAVVNSMVLETYSDLTVKKYGRNSLQSAVDYSVANWTNSYTDLPYSVRNLIDDFVNKDEWYRARSDEEYKLDFYIDELATVQSLFDDISQSTNSIPYLSPSAKNELQFITMSETYDDESIAHFKDENGDYVKHSDMAVHLKESDLFGYDFELSDASKVYNRVDVDFGFDAALQEYRYNFSLSAATFLNEYRTSYYGDEPKIKKLELKKFKRSESAIRYATYFLLDKCNRHLEASLELPAKFIYLSIGDLIVFDELLGGIKPYNIDYTKDYDADTESFIEMNGQRIFKYFLVTEVTKSLKGIKIKARQMHDLVPFKNTGVVGCSDQEGDIVNGLLCIRTPDNFSEDVNVGISSYCSHVLGCATEGAENYLVGGDGDPVNENGDKITLHDPSLCVWPVEEEVEDEEDDADEEETDEGNDVEDPDEEAEDDTEEDTYGDSYINTHRDAYWYEIGTTTASDMWDFSADTFTGEWNPGQYVLENMVKIMMSVTYNNSIDNYSFKDWLHNTDTISNTADPVSFKINAVGGTSGTMELEGFPKDTYQLYLIMTNGQQVRLNNSTLVSAFGSHYDAIFSGLFRFVPPGTAVINSSGQEQQLDHNCIEQYGAYRFADTLNDSQISQLYGSLIEGRWIDSWGKIKFKLKLRYITESFVDEFGNTVEAVAMNNEYDELVWTYQTDLQHYEIGLDQSGVMLGDINTDNTVNILDVVATVQYVLGNYDTNYVGQIAADINMDDTVNVLDIVETVQLILNSPGYTYFTESAILDIFLTTPILEPESLWGINITETYSVVGFSSFFTTSAGGSFTNTAIRFLPSPDGVTYINESYHENIVEMLASNDYGNILQTLNPAAGLVSANTPIDINVNESFYNDDIHEQGTIRRQYNTAHFTGGGTDEYVIAIALIENEDGSVEVSTKPFHINI